MHSHGRLYQKRMIFGSIDMEETSMLCSAFNDAKPPRSIIVSLRIIIKKRGRSLKNSLKNPNGQSPFLSFLFPGKKMCFKFVVKGV